MEGAEDPDLEDKRGALVNNAGKVYETQSKSGYACVSEGIIV